MGIVPTILIIYKISFIMAQQEHKLYKLVPKEESDAVAWVFNQANVQPVEYPFKFPEMRSDEIRIKQTYTGLCFTDLSIALAQWFDVEYPLCPGHEVLGRVTHVGADVSQYRVGDLVGFGFIRDSCDKCKQCYHENDNLCQNVGGEKLIPYPKFGGFATHVQAPAKWAFPIPASIPQEVCPPLMCAGITVFAPLKRFFEQGATCAIAGIGGLGHLGIQFAAKLGYSKVGALSTRANKKDEAQSYGATDFVDVNDKAQVQKYQNTFDMILVCANVFESNLVETYISTLRGNGKLVIVGIPPRGTDVAVPFSSLIGKQIQVIGSLVGSREENYQMLEFAAKHKIYPVCEQYEFKDFPKAVERLFSSNPRYRCVVKMPE